MSIQQKSPATGETVTQAKITFESTTDNKCTENSTQSQNRKILSLLKERNLTALDALRLCDCWSLSQRIFNLRCQGHQIVTTMKTLQNKKRIAEYSLLKKEGQ